MDKLSEKIISALKSNTYNSVYLNTLAKLPIIITREGTFINSMEISGDVYPELLETGEKYLGELRTEVRDIEELENYEPENIVRLKVAKIVEWLSRKCKLINVDKFHYDDTWYTHRCSIDPNYSAENFGILQVGNLPFRSLDKLMNKKSFICRMDQLMFNGIMQPFMLFIDRKFVNWNAIDVVFDCDEAYLLLHGNDYTYYKLQDVKEMHMVILPFKAEYIGVEPDSIWQKNYEMFCNFLQDSLHIIDDNGNEKIVIDVPTMYSIYKKRGMVYNVGAWLYTQLYINHLGLLSDERISKLKKINLVRNIYDKAGNIISSYNTKFNAFDKDSYDRDTYIDICNYDLNYLEERAIFKFNDEGKLDYENGCNIIANLDKSMTIERIHNSDSKIIIDHSKFDECLFKENYLIFKDGEYYPEYNYSEDYDNLFIKHGMNIFTMDNSDNNNCDILLFNPADIESTIEHKDNFYKDAFKKIILDYISSDDKDTNIEELIKLSTEQLNYSFSDSSLYENNLSQGLSSIVGYNPLLLNNLIKTSIKSTVITGKEANESLTFALGNETRKGLKIPRYKYSDHETYVIIFVNGELIENYSEMYASSNYFFLPVDKDFGDGDIIEFLYFTDCDNNEIHFNITDGMLLKYNSGYSETDYKFVTNYSYQSFYDMVQSGKCYTNIYDYITFRDNTIPSYEDFYNNVQENKYSLVYSYEDFCKISKITDINQYYEYVSKKRDEYIKPLYEKYLKDELNKLQIFSKYINQDDIKIFADYPEEIMVYKDLIDKSNDIAFNISYRNTNGDLLLFKDAVENKSNNLTAVSSRKFIYERLYVDQKAYRIKLSERFRYCDNQKQYMLFINGRRMEDDSFLITIPKYSRPFWGMYLYTSKFVKPGDRIELFYVSEELTNINTEELTPITFDENGFMETEKDKLSVPLNNDFYLYFVNGKKIPSTDIIPIDSYTIKLKSDTGTLLRLNVNKAYSNIDETIKSYMEGKAISKYDTLIKYIKETESLGYTELNKLFNSNTTISNDENEQDIYINSNVKPIAIINEIIRDFWVTSGFEYNTEPFIYDYALDEIIAKDKHGNYILPSLDASIANSKDYINIAKNNIRLKDFYNEYGTNTFEIGSSLDGIGFYWNFTDPIEGTESITSQYANDNKINPPMVTENDDNYYYYRHNGSIDKDTEFNFQFNTLSSTIYKQVNIKFCNGIYYGVIDEDELQYYINEDLYLLNRLFLVTPKNGDIPSSIEQSTENMPINMIKWNNNIIAGINTILSSTYQILADPNTLSAIMITGSDIPCEIFDKNGNIIDGLSIVTIKDLDTDKNRAVVIDKDKNIVAEVLEDLEIYNETVDKNGKVSITISPINKYFNEKYLPKIMKKLKSDKVPVYQDSVSLDFNKYKIGSNNYFVYACPKRLAYDADGNRIIHFNMPDLNDQDLINYGKDDHTVPVYTNGCFDSQNNLVRLDKCEMEYMGEFDYTNGSGYTETYVMWKSNGFFTRKYDDYEFDMSVIDGDAFVEENKVTETLDKVESFRILNTSSTSGSEINDEIVFIDALFL